MHLKNKKIQKEKKSSFKSIYPWNILACLAITLIAYRQTFFNAFVNQDDYAYLINNTTVKSFDIYRILTEPMAGNYHPLTMFFLAIEYQIFGHAEGWYHAVDLALHLINTFLVFVIFSRLTKNEGTALIISLLFGIHPMHVESVAWMSETKDVLYSVFYLSAWLVYVTYIQGTDRKTEHLWLTGSLFLLSLLSKGMAVTFPVVLLLTHYLTGVEKEKKIKTFIALIFIMAVAFGIITVIAQQNKGAINTAIISENGFLSFQQYKFACYALISYVLKFLWPVNLSSFYFYPAKDSGWLLADTAIVTLVLTIVVGLLISRYKYVIAQKHILFGTGFFIINIALVLQLVPVGSAIMADRYSYLSYIGLFYLVAYAVNYFITKDFIKTGIKIAGTICLLLLFYLTSAQVNTWKDSEHLWTKVIDVFPRPNAYGFRANIYIDKKEWTKAERDLTAAIKLDPTNGEYYLGRSNVRANLDNPADIISDCDSAIKYLAKPEYLANAYQNRGMANSLTGKTEAGIRDLKYSLNLNPALAMSCLFLGDIYDQMGNLDSAKTWYDKAKQLGASQ